MRVAAAAVQHRTGHRRSAGVDVICDDAIYGSPGADQGSGGRRAAGLESPNHVLVESNRKRVTHGHTAVPTCRLGSGAHATACVVLVRVLSDPGGRRAAGDLPPPRAHRFPQRA
jgi:hypothetical protein